jgi:hypothetical protein
LNAFPEKPQGVIRIVILGGSSTAGNALRSNNTQTIAAWLERLLNADAPPSRRFQVLNFGVSGGSSWSEMNRFFAEVVHLQPDLVISFDGWNDAVFSTFEHDRQGLLHEIANWSQLSHLYFERMLRMEGSRATAPPPVFTYTYLLLREHVLLGQDDPKTRRRTYEAYPAYRLSAYWIEKYGGLDFLLPTHWEAIASYCRAKDVAYIAYLQPFADYKRTSPAEESADLDRAHALVIPTSGALWQRDRYRETIRPVYIRYQQHVRRLGEAYTGAAHIRFRDITDLFVNTPETIYLDMIHYNERGNELLARRMRTDVREALGAIVGRK